MLVSPIEKLNDFFAKFKQIVYKKGEIIIREDEEPAGVYFLKVGFVKMGAIFVNGGELTLNIFKPGSFFPMMWAIGETKNSYFCQAMSEVKVYRAPKADVIKFVKENSDVLYDLTRRILVGMDGMITNVQFLLFGSSYNRIAAAILLLAKRFGEKTTNGPVVISLNLIHQDIAQLSGVTRETASIALKQLEKRGVISHLKKRFVVNNINKLTEEIFVTGNELEIPLTI
ncbi:Crp/Fnr family transcriptional regulator [Candidatus Daviesbacteria bacterium]|nr:Crp/Fnr family transcriptional regulator [Candidatus Daviesbacteria bacterium]